MTEAAWPYFAIVRSLLYASCRGPSRYCGLVVAQTPNSQLGVRSYSGRMVTTLNRAIHYIHCVVHRAWSTGPQLQRRGGVRGTGDRRSRCRPRFDKVDGDGPRVAQLYSLAPKAVSCTDHVPASGVKEGPLASRRQQSCELGPLGCQCAGRPQRVDGESRSAGAPRSRRRAAPQFPRSLVCR